MKTPTAIIILTITLLWAWAICFAAGRPEFDAVGDDSQSYFLDLAEIAVIENAVDGFGRKINHYSSFPEEYFTTTAGIEYPDPCFPGYLSALTSVWSQEEYQWRIVLQMAPESDILLKVVTCTLSYDKRPDPWTGSIQIGRYILYGMHYFDRYVNPKLSVEACPGPYATRGFTKPFYLDAWAQPRLTKTPLCGARFTSHGLFEQSVDIALPETGAINTMGQLTYKLKQGDSIRVTVGVQCNPADVRLGRNGVILNYIGSLGTEWCRVQ